MEQKNILIALVIILSIGVVGYFTLVKKQSPSNVTQNSADDCDLISNSSFRSINQGEVGLGPNGPEMGYWGIQFQKSTTLSDYSELTFDWGHSDVSESGTYTCKNNVLQAKFSNYSMTAYYDGAKEILTWGGVEYERVK